MPMDVSRELLPLVLFIFIAMEITKVIDNVVFQPQIFSRSVKSHPLEIFIVILIAATIGGVIGMLIAIPAYTVLRVIAKEFFNQNKLVQKITEGL
jgi:predicted PurR-regulated permease PerM